MEKNPQNCLLEKSQKNEEIKGRNGWRERAQLRPSCLCWEMMAAWTKGREGEDLRGISKAASWGVRVHLAVVQGEVAWGSRGGCRLALVESLCAVCSWRRNRRRTSGFGNEGNELNSKHTKSLLGHPSGGCLGSCVHQTAWEEERDGCVLGLSAHLPSKSSHILDLYENIILQPASRVRSWESSSRTPSPWTAFPTPVYTGRVQQQIVLVRESLVTSILFVWLEFLDSLCRCVHSCSVWYIPWDLITKDDLRWKKLGSGIPVAECAAVRQGHIV